MRRDSATEKREQALTRAALLLKQGDLARAAAVLEAARAEAPDDDRLLIKLAEVRRRQGRTGDAVEIYLLAGSQHARRGFALRSVALLKQAYLLDPASPLVLEPLADRYLELGQQREALRYLEELADASERAGDRQRLQVALRRAIDLAPTTAAHVLRLATHLAAIGQAGPAADLLDKAAARLDAAGDLDGWLSVTEQLAHLRAPDRAGRLRLARGLLEQGHSKRSLRHLQACLAVDRRDVEVLELLVRTFDALGLETKSAAARRELEMVLQPAAKEQAMAPPPLPSRPTPVPQRPPEAPVVEHLRKAEILVRYQEHERALGDLALAIAAAPEDPEPHLRSRDVLLVLGRPVEAAREAVLAIEALLRCGRAEEAGRAVQALRHIEFGIEARPAGGQGEDLGLLGAELDEEEIVSLDEDPAYAVEEVVARFRAGVSRTVRPEDAATHHDLGIAFFEMELFRQALEEFETALAADPVRRADCLVMIGRCRLGLGEPQEATEALEQAIVQPDLPPEARAAAYGHLASALEATGHPRAALLHLREALRLAPGLPGLVGRIEALVACLAPPTPMNSGAWELEPTPSAA